MKFTSMTPVDRAASGGSDARVLGLRLLDDVLQFLENIVMAGPNGGLPNHVSSYPTPPSKSGVCSSPRAPLWRATDARRPEGRPSGADMPDRGGSLTPTLEAARRAEGRPTGTRRPGQRPRHGSHVDAVSGHRVLCPHARRLSRGRPRGPRRQVRHRMRRRSRADRWRAWPRPLRRRRSRVGRQASGGGGGGDAPSARRGATGEGGRERAPSSACSVARRRRISDAPRPWRTRTPEQRCRGRICCCPRISRRHKEVVAWAFRELTRDRPRCCAVLPSRTRSPVARGSTHGKPVRFNCHACFTRCTGFGVYATLKHLRICVQGATMF